MNPLALKNPCYLSSAPSVKDMRSRPRLSFPGPCVLFARVAGTDQLRAGDISSGIPRIAPPTGNT